MASISESIPAPRQSSVLGRNGLIDKYFYLVMALIIPAIVVWGFNHTVDQRLIHAAVRRPAIAWIHGAAFSAWVLFFLLQSALVRTRNVKLHRLLGWFGAGLGTFMVPVGVIAAVVMSRFDTKVLHEPGGDAFLIIPFYDMLAFAVIFGLAVLWRKKPEFHRRLVFIATCNLLDAAFGRGQNYFFQHYFFFCADGVILLGVVRDLLVNRQVHKVYLAVLPPMIAAQAFVTYTWMSSAGWWLKIGRAIIG